MENQEFEVNLTLISGEDSISERRFIVSPTNPMPLGRSSKSNTRQLTAGVNNGYVANPVVSRDHAVITVCPNLPASIRTYGHHVSVRDEGSMHGTFLNNHRLGLSPNKLRDGDTLQLGSNVTREADTFKAPKYRVEILKVNYSSPYEAAVVNTFRVPDSFSDSENDTDSRSNSSRSNQMEPESEDMDDLMVTINEDRIAALPEFGRLIRLGSRHSSVGGFEPPTPCTGATLFPFVLEEPPFSQVPASRGRLRICDVLNNKNDSVSEAAMSKPCWVPPPFAEPEEPAERNDFAYAFEPRPISACPQFAMAKIVPSMRPKKRTFQESSMSDELGELKDDDIDMTGIEQAHPVAPVLCPGEVDSMAGTTPEPVVRTTSEPPVSKRARFHLASAAVGVAVGAAGMLATLATLPSDFF